MTFKEKMKAMIVAYAVSEGDADKIINECKEHKALDSMKGRWNDDVSGYPPMMQGIAWNSVKAVAHEWIEKNQPKAFYKSLFA